MKKTFGTLILAGALLAPAVPALSAPVSGLPSKAPQVEASTPRRALTQKKVETSVSDMETAAALTAQQKPLFFFSGYVSYYTFMMVANSGEAELRAEAVKGLGQLQQIFPENTGIASLKSDLEAGKLTPDEALPRYMAVWEEIQEIVGSNGDEGQWYYYLGVWTTCLDTSLKTGAQELANEAVAKLKALSTERPLGVPDKVAQALDRLVAGGAKEAAQMDIETVIAAFLG